MRKSRCVLRESNRGQRTQQGALTTRPFSVNGLHFHLRKFPLVTPGGIEPQALWILTKSVLSLALYQLDHMATGKIFLGEGTWYPVCCNLAALDFPTWRVPANLHFRGLDMWCKLLETIIQFAADFLKRKFVNHENQDWKSIFMSSENQTWTL